METSTKSSWPIWRWWILLGSAAILCSIGSASWSIYILDEVKNASCALEMTLRNDWVVPTFNGELRTDKPVLHYYAMRIAYTLGGINPFAARIFSGLMGVFTIFFTVWFSKKIVGPEVAWYTGLILLSSMHFCFEFHLAVPDPFLIAFVGLACFAFYYALEYKRSRFLWIAYAALGLGGLAKGPIAIAIPALSLFLHLLLSGWSWKKVLFLINPWGILIFCTLALPWYFAVHYATDGVWTQGFFLDHNIDRFSDTMEGHGGPFFLPWLFILFGLLPFSIFLFRSGDIWKSIVRDRFLRYCLGISIVIAIIFSISQTKLPNYTMPSYPFISILIAYTLHKLLKRQFPLALIILFILFTACTIASWIYLTSEPLFETVAWKAALSFTPIIISLFIILIRWKNVITQQIIHHLTIGSAACSILIFAWAYPSIDKLNPISKAEDMIDNAEQIVAYDQFNPAIVFKKQSIIPVVKNPTTLMAYLDKYPDALIISRKKFSSTLAEHGITIIAEGKDLFDNSVTAWYQLDTGSVED